MNCFTKKKQQKMYGKKRKCVNFTKFCACIVSKKQNSGPNRAYVTKKCVNMQ